MFRLPDLKRAPLSFCRVDLPNAALTSGRLPTWSSPGTQCPPLLFLVRGALVWESGYETEASGNA